MADIRCFGNVVINADRLLFAVVEDVKDTNEQCVKLRFDTGEETSFILSEGHSLTNWFPPQPTERDGLDGVSSAPGAMASSAFHATKTSES